MCGKRYAFPMVLLVAGVVGGPATGLAQSPGEGQNSARPEVLSATRTDTSAPLRDLPQIPPTPAVVGEIFERPRKLLPNREGSPAPAATDPVLQGPTPATGAPTSGDNFEGIENVNSVLPPDPSGAIGPNHYVQVVNLSYAIWPRGASVPTLGPANINTLWQGFGGPCQTTNDGDPIVLYDHLADRWMISQFALPNFPRGPFYQCIAVSQGPDPTLAWHRYEFTISADKLNDYPKFGVWPDGYYMAINQFKCNFARCSWAGQAVVAFERDKMLLGQQARGVLFDLYSVDVNLGGMLPSDLDGLAPPAGAPNYFVQVDDNAWGYSPDQLQIWQFSVNWSSPTSSTFTSMANLGTASFDANLCGYSRNCIPQPGGTKVDAISDRLMYRLQYRNFGTHQTLVVNHTVDVNGADRAGIRWYELRNTSGTWGIHQQGTYSPDGDHRWMGSVAMNGQGDMALGYSKSSTTFYPSVYATGRLSGDASGQMTQGEVVIVNGTGYQSHSSGRWGDYSQMSVDPTDDCTFWYTQEYYAVSGNAPWQTRVGSFKLRNCGPVNAAPSVSIANPAEGATVTGTVTIQISASDAEDAAGSLTVEWNVDGVAWQAASYNGVSGYYEASWLSSSVGDGSHTINARATDSGSATGSDSNAVVVDNVANTAPTASFTYLCSGLTCNFDGSGSTDGDGTISSYAWNFGDGTTGSGATPSHAYAAGGTYTVTLTVTDNEGATDDDSQSVTVTAPAGMHVGDLDGASSAQGNSKWKATVTITVHDSNHSPVSSATVSGSWSGGASGSASCTTNGSGQCSVNKTNIANANSVTFTVSGVTGSLSYNAADNHDPDGDSNGTAITFTKQ